MWTLLIFSTILALTIAAPPIIPESTTNGGCIDGVNNVVDVGNVGNENALSIRASNVIARTYDSKGKPSCYKGRAAVELPGIIKLVNGTITVTKSLDLKTSGDIRLTLAKDSYFVGTVCKNGVSETRLISSADCHTAIFPDFGEEFVDMISTPGTYDLQEIEKKTGESNVLKLPAIHGMKGYIAEGDWKTQIALVSAGETVANVKVPSNTNWLYVN